MTEHGSLRSIKHYRGKQLIEVIDAYDLLLRGVGLDQKRFESGDSLLVPPVGAQVRIEGMVRRPAVYELRDGMTLEEALDLAGGILPAAALKHVEVERLVAHENRTMISLNLTENAIETRCSITTHYLPRSGWRPHSYLSNCSLQRSGYLSSGSRTASRPLFLQKWDECH